MPNSERNWNRCLSYSQWHRAANFSQYVGPVKAAQCTQIDIDWCEYCHKCMHPVALIETTHGKEPKNAEVTARLAGMAGIEAWSIAFEHDGTHDGHSLPTRFVIWRVAPASARIDTQITLQPDQYANWLLNLRTGHHCVAL